MTAHISEKAFQRMVLEYAGLMGWWCYHTFDSRGSQSGFPDLCMVRDGRLVFAELKRENGKLTEAQEDWIYALGEVEYGTGDIVDVHVWRPSDWATIEQVLKR